jgi:dTDP-4-dehydrorhamnose reductase
VKQILVTGSNGQLGSEMQFLSKKYSQYKFHFTDVQDLDITDLEELRLFLSNHSIDYIINCAAYTAVDKAEEEKEFSDKLNHIAVANLLEASKKKGSKLFQISTDYVFGGMHNTPLTENLETHPESSYGETKLKGEKVALKSKRAIVIRTSWLYSSYGNNFVKTIRKYAKEKEELSVVFDQIGTPTYARDLAESILNIIDLSEKNKDFRFGIYHYANEGVLSWFDFAVEICQLSKIKVNISPVLSDQFPTPAKRPAYSVLDKHKIKATFGLSIPYWKDSLIKCISILEK